MTMRAPDSFTKLRNTTVQVLTTAVKKFLEDPGAILAELSGSESGTDDAVAFKEDPGSLGRAFDVEWECLAGRDMGGKLEDVLATVRRLDA